MYFLKKCFLNGNKFKKILFFIFSTKGGYDMYEKWKRHWSSKARTEAAVANFMVDQIMPYWVQCQAEGCGKWRQLSRGSDLTPEFIDSFQCGMTTTQNSTSKVCFLLIHVVL